MAPVEAAQLAGRVEVLSEMRDTMGLIMLEPGRRPGRRLERRRLLRSLDILREKIDSGHIRKVLGNSYTQDLALG